MTQPAFYRFEGGGGTYQNLAVAKRDAQQHANQTGGSVAIQKAKGGKGWKPYATVKPKIGNPGSFLKRLKRGITGRIKIVGKGRNRRLEVHT